MRERETEDLAPPALDRRVVGRLEDLIRAHLDSAGQLAEVAARISDPHLKDDLTATARTREPAAARLGTLLASPGGRPERRRTSGTWRRRARRLRLDLPSALARRTPDAVLAEADRAESALRARRETAARATALSRLAAVLHEQAAEVGRSRDGLRTTRATRAAAAHAP